MRLSDNGCENVEEVYTNKTFRGPFKTVTLKYINLKNMAIFYPLVLHFAAELFILNNEVIFKN